MKSTFLEMSLSSHRSRMLNVSTIEPVNPYEYAGELSGTDQKWCKIVIRMVYQVVLI